MHTEAKSLANEFGRLASWPADSLQSQRREGEHLRLAIEASLLGGTGDSGLIRAVAMRPLERTKRPSDSSIQNVTF